VAGQQKPKKMKMTKSYAQPFGETLTAKKTSKDQISPDGIGRTPLALPEVPSHAPEPVAEVPTGFRQFADDALAANANLEPKEEAARMAAALHVPSPLRFDPIRNAFTCNLPARPPFPSAVPKIIAPTVVVTASPSPGPAAVQPATAGELNRLPKKVIRQPQPADEPLTTKKPKMIPNSHFPSSTTTIEEDLTKSILDCDGYTSADSNIGCPLGNHEWRLHQAKTRSYATNPGVRQYWHFVKKDNVIEHQVLGSVKPIMWSVFKRPYNFHLKLRDIQDVFFARGSTRVIVTHKKGRDGWDVGPRGNVLAQFKRKTTAKRFLTFIAKRKRVMVVEVGV
jgi:hypothetical protein